MVALLNESEVASALLNARRVVDLAKLGDEVFVPSEAYMASLFEPTQATVSIKDSVLAPTESLIPGYLSLVQSMAKNFELGNVPAESMIKSKAALMKQITSHIRDNVLVPSDAVTAANEAMMQRLMAQAGINELGVTSAPAALAAQAKLAKNVMDGALDNMAPQLFSRGALSGGPLSPAQKPTAEVKPAKPSSSAPKARL